MHHLQFSREFSIKHFLVFFLLPSNLLCKIPNKQLRRESVMATEIILIIKHYLNNSTSICPSQHIIFIEYEAKRLTSTCSHIRGKSPLKEAIGESGY